MQRRRFLSLAATAAPALLGTPVARAQAHGHVVVIGGGFGGATTAKYLRQANRDVKITMVEPNANFVMCPMSNRVLYGGMAIRDLTRPYERFAMRYNLDWVRGMADEIDPARRTVSVGSQKISYDRLIVAPGVEILSSAVPGLEKEDAQQRIPHAWKAGEQTLRLRRRLVDLPDGETVAMHIPKVPYRCPPGPYERASLIAYYLSDVKPRSKLLIFDANPEIQAKKSLFEKAWRERYGKQIEYHPNAEIRSVDAASGTVDFEVHGKVRSSLWNIIPPQRAGKIATRNGLANVGNRWCAVDFLTYESTSMPGVHVIGDSIASAPGMPKSGHMANQEAKVCAAAVASLLAGEAPVSNPIIANTCYSFVSQTEVIHVASVFKYDGSSRLMKAVKDSGGLSETATVAEGIYAMAWAGNILNDTLG